MKTKSGTAMKEKLVAFDHATDPTTPSPTVQPLSQSSPSTPTTPSDTAISSPIANRTNISAMRSAPRTGSLKRGGPGDRKSTRLNSSHLVISYAVFCLKKKNITSKTTLLNRLSYGYQPMRAEVTFEGR